VTVLRKRRRLLIAGAILVVALFVIRPGAGGLKSYIAHAISLAMGRQVEIGGVRIRVLPQPGFDLENFVVHDDPNFGAEPVLRSEDVTAAVRLTSLLRGRLEVARLSFTEPSVNLVRNRDGHWNLENLLERTAKIAVAPTGKTRSERRPGFPYIEADRARINFKFEQEKKPYALTSADFSLWQDSENAWSMRLKAQPLRTDFNLSDTGFLRVSGSWQRASTLHETPMQFSLEWDRAQLGQVTKFISGRDRGWRGTLSTAVTISGNPADLVLTATTSIQDFRRYDISTTDALRLAVHCVAHYKSTDREFRQIICGAPVGEGNIALQGRIAGLLAPYDYDLSLSAEDVPIQALVKLARHVKQNLPEDLLASGSISTNLTVRGTRAQPPLWQGGGQTRGFRLRSTASNTDLSLGRIPIEITSGFSVDTRLISPRRPRTQIENKTNEMACFVPAQSGVHVELGPFTLMLGRSTPAVVRAWASRSGYSVSLQGDVGVRHLLQLAQTLGLPAAQAAAQGNARVDLRVAGQWSGFPAPAVTGTAQLNLVRAEVRGLNAPLEITSGNLTLADKELQFQNLSAVLGASRWMGSLSLPRHCSSPQACPLAFRLHTDELNTDTLNELFNPHPPKPPWYRLLGRFVPPRPSILTELEASGELTADRMVVRDLVGYHVNADVELQNGKLRLSALRADMLAGKHMGDWQADFTLQPPLYTGAGTLERVSLEQLAKSMQEGWITGTASATYRLSASGYSAAELFASAKAALLFQIHNGTLPHIALGDAGAPFHMRRFTGRLVLEDGQLEIREGKLEAFSGLYQVSGTASPGHNLNIRVQDAWHAFSITGTIGQPHVVAVAGTQTQAALKP
jgi:AsmA family/AsmA-like C-terminal region